MTEDAIGIPLISRTIDNLSRFSPFYCSFFYGIKAFGTVEHKLYKLGKQFFHSIRTNTRFLHHHKLKMYGCFFHNLLLIGMTSWRIPKSVI
jgi:hypothetical protein